MYTYKYIEKDVTTLNIFLLIKILKLLRIVPKSTKPKAIYPHKKTFLRKLYKSEVCLTEFTVLAFKYLL